MLRDVFYYGDKPNVHPREQLAENLADARSKAITRDFWIINEFCDYRNFDWDFDFEFLPDEDVWAEDHNNVWPSQHQKDSGTWLCPKEHSDIIIYRNDVDPVIRKNQKNNNWVELDLINHNKFDFSWHPDPTDPPYVYKWPSKFFPAEFKHVLEYRVPGATQEKYMNTIAELVPEYDRWVEHQEVDKSRFDMSWRPNPLDPPFIYVWGNKYIDGKLKPTLEYHAPDATDKKYMPEHISVLPEWDRWVEVQSVDKNKFDFSWRPDPREPAFIYVFGNEQHEGTIMPTVEYHCPDATDVKYVDDIKAKLAPKKELFEHLEDSYGIDYSWRPDPTSPPYIYAWGNQWNTPEDKVSIQFVVPGATEYKYIDERAIRRPCMDNWIIPEDVDTTGFDFSWEPSPAAPPYIYEFATQWQKTGGPQYVVPGATEKQYVDFQKVRKLSSTDNWNVPNNIDSTGFDFSWHPDDTSPPYTYVFATQWAFSGGPVYTVEGATEIKYVDDQIAIATKDMTNWVYDSTLIDLESFDFSWHPYVEDQPYVYEFGTQWQKTGGPKYITPGADSSSPVKYIDTRIIKAERLPNKRDMSWVTHLSIKQFDYSWHPDNTDEPYIYVFGNNLYPAEECSTIEYRMSGATQVKYVNEIVATLDVDMDNWEVPFDIDTSEFDFSWIPNPNDPPYIYQFGTQWQKTGGPRYVVDAATEVKYLDFQKTIALHTTENWKVSENIDVTNFDFGWHPDDTDPPYIYQFGTQWALSGGPKYIVEGATEIKYIDELVATSLPDKTNWVFDETEIDVNSFDFSWHPYVEDQPYVYEFGTQWQKTGGPKYITPGADSSSPTKYIDTRIIKANRLSNPSNDRWKIINDYKIKDFDFSWHPDNTEEPYIYVFGNNLYPAEECPTVEYRVSGATKRKYVGDIVATLGDNTDNWVITQPIDESKFDFSWIPNPKDPPYVYRWGNRYVSNKYKPTIEYVVPGATDIKYMSDDVAVLPEMDKWDIPKNVDTLGFDFTWRPDPLEPDQIYQFGTQWQKTGGPRYVVPDATEIKYLDFQKVISLPSRDNWRIPSNVDTVDFDFSWHPDDTDPAYIYQFGTQWALSGGPAYHVPGATEIKYMDEQTALALPSKDNWVYDPNLIDAKTFDFSWHPYAEDQPYIYEFGTQWQKTGGPKYITPGADSSSPIKYIDTRILKAKRLPNKEKYNWVSKYKIKDFDYSWHPDDTEEPYIYVFGNNLYPAEECSTIEYHASGATEKKYVRDIIATLGVNDNWEIPTHIDTAGFDFTWIPNPNDPLYIYEFGTQHQKTGGPRYVVPGAVEIKYLDFQKVIALSNKDNWTFDLYIDTSSFDFSWHPDATDPPYIYAWGNQWVKVEDKPSIEYTVSGATEYRYMEGNVIRKPCMDNWIVPKDVDVGEFDFSWEPSPKEEPYIYQVGTQWQKTGGPRYVVNGATEIKYLDYKVTKLPNSNDPCWVTNYKIKDFDWSWHPDNTEEPYIYVFGNNLYPAEECATIEYRMPNATQTKYINDIIATLDVDMTNWVIPKNVETTGFDFSWIPNPNEPAYIYEFGTQHQQTGGPRYAVSGAVETKYVDFQHATILPNTDNWVIPENVDASQFDFSWHPNDTEPAYIYQFGTQWALSGGPRYVVLGATEIKYMDEQTALALPDKTNWVYDEALIDIETFDFSWHPYVEDQPYVYQFGTQWQKTGGPKYVTPGADLDSPVKYIDTRIIKATRLEDTENTHWVRNYPIKEFDFSWHPDETEDPYIYVFGNNQYLAEECATIEYRIPGATTVKYIPDIVARLDVNMDKWVIPDDVDATDFDFSWIPNPSEPPYIYEFGTQWQKTGGPQYVMPGAWRGTKYVDVQTAKRLPDNQYWTIPDYIDKTSFDFSWHPDATEEPYNYVFATQWAFSGGPVYTVPGATEIKYVDEQTATALPDKTNWEYDPDIIDAENFDFSWHPYVEDQPYIYQFGTQWWETGGPRYITPGTDSSSPIKYIDTRIIKSTTLPRLDNWEIPESVDIDKFDLSWVPHPEDPPYIYVFGNQWFTAEKMPTVKYQVEGATEVKYVSTIIATLKPDMTNWIVPKNIVIKDFDFSWVPDPYDPPYNYIFGNQWYGAQEMTTVTYASPGATEDKFVTDIVATLGKNLTNWEIPKEIDVRRFDFSWIPHPAAPPYIYQFGTLQDPTDGPKYITPTNTGQIVRVPRLELDIAEVEEEIVVVAEPKPKDIEINRYYITTTLEALANQHVGELFWALNPDIDYSNFDFSWRPNIEQAHYVHAFGSTDNINTQTYFVNGPQWAKNNRDLNYVDDVKIDIKVNIDMFFVDRGNLESAARFEALKAKFGTRIQKTRYLNSWVDTINRCANRATSSLIWVLNSELDYNDFNFDYYPNPWQMKMVHVFGTQWSHWGTTFMVNRETFAEDTKYINIIEHLSNLNFVKDIRATATRCVHDIVIIDHGNKELADVSSLLQSKASGKTVTTVSYQESYLKTFKDIIARQQAKKEHYIWVCSSVCDYSNFDFSYVCDPFSRDNLHVFPSGKQKFGDTFFIDVNNAREVIGELEQLENFTKVNYNAAIKAARLPEPIIVTNDDTHTNAASKITDFPYVTLITSDNSDIGKADIEPMNLWSPETKNIYVTSTGATRIVVPKEIKNHVTKELYEYPYIKRAPKLALSNPLDIVFLSNGETGAEENYEHLLSITKNLPNRVVRVDGVNGRAAAYHAAAEASNTPWMFTVFAKLKVSPKFDFNWQPDRMQVPKHYIFHAKNPVNGLTYGHQAMIAYNKKLTLANDGRGLDFTLDDEHEVVPLISGTAQYNTDEFSTWRTAFREVIKLRADDSDVSKERLDAWLNKASGDFAQYSIKGALDADEYYDEVDGDFDKLRLSYEWAWLREKFDQF